MSSPRRTLRPFGPFERTLVALALAALGVFLAELALLRAVAQVTWPPFAFLALSAAMLGGGVAGTALAVRPALARHPALPSVGALVVAAGAPAAMATALLAGLEPLEVGRSPAAAATFVAVLAALATPFAGLALLLSSALERHADAAARVYGADLAGAALGAFSSVAVMRAVGPASTAGLAGALAALAALLAAPRAREGRALRAASAALGLGALVAAVLLHGVVPAATVEKRVHFRPVQEVLGRLARAGTLVTADGADGRVDVVPGEPTALLVDLGAALTRVAPPLDALGPRWPRTSASFAAFLARAPEGPVLVVGSGAGWEVAAALAHGAPRVDAIEVSRSVVDAARAVPEARALYADPRVHLHLDEARSFLERAPADARWSHVVASHTITNAAMAASAMRLAEDFLLTEQAMRTLVGRLAPRGVLYVTRPRGQIGLLADLARAALRHHGVPDAEVDDHLALVASATDPFFAGLLVFEDAAFGPGHARRSVPAPDGFTIEPPPRPTGRRLPTDDRPFFHRSADDPVRGGARMAIEGPRLAERSLLWVGALSTALAALALVVPLALRRRSVGPAPAAVHLGIAALLGVGFMTLELSLAQRLTLFAGRPVVAFAAVVGGMLLGAGATALVVPRGRPSTVVALIASAACALLATLLPDALGALGVLAAPPAVRFGAVALGAALIASPLGLPFPGLVADARAAAGAAPWLFAVNATTSVAATALYGALAPALGIRVVTLLAAACYAAAAALALAAPGDARADARVVPTGGPS